MIDQVLKGGNPEAEIHIGSAFDQNYFRPFVALANSILRVHPRGTVFFHLITEGIGLEMQREISQWIEDRGQQIRFYPAWKEQVNEFVIQGNWSHAVYYRLFFPGMLAQRVSRLVYLDCDMIVIRPLFELNNVSLQGCPVGGVWDNYVGTQPSIGILEVGKYFNSGFLLIDVAKWNEEKISEKAAHYLVKHPERIRFVDQCALNAVLIDRWCSLPTRFNLLTSFLPSPLTRSEMRRMLKEVSIFHFTLDRPWHMLSKNRFRYLYKKNFEDSPFFKQGHTFDFALNKIPTWILIRLVEWYHDNERFKKVWRSLKRRIDS